MTVPTTELIDALVARVGSTAVQMTVETGIDPKVAWNSVCENLNELIEERQRVLLPWYLRTAFAESVAHDIKQL